MAILEKILAIRDELEVEKSGWDERNEYAYFKADDVARSVRAGMVRHGVIHRTKVLEFTVENIIDKQGRVRPAAQGLYEFTFIDVSDGSEFSVNSVGSGGDIGGDKATRKMAVQAFKIALIDTFTIVDDMGVVDSDRDEEAPSLNEGAEPEAEKPASAADLSKVVGDMVRDPSLDHVTNDVVVKIGRRIATSIMGADTPDKDWKRDARVLSGVIEAIEKGELE